MTSHCVERSSRYWISVHHVEISVVFLLNKCSEFFLSDCVNIFERVLNDSVFFEKLNTFLEGNLDNRSLDLERFERELLIDGSDFLSKTGF